MNQRLAHIIAFVLAATLPVTSFAQTKKDSVNYLDGSKPKQIQTKVANKEAALKDLKKAQKSYQMGGSNGGGGDDLGLEFQGAFDRAMEKLATLDPASFQQVEQKDLEAVLKKIQILVVDDALDVQVKDIIQNSVATNNPDTDVIMINRTRWSKITDDKLKEGIALHEVLSLLKMEQTGFYPISGKYIAALGKSAADLSKNLSVDRLQQITAEVKGEQPFNVLKRFFDEAMNPASLNDFESVDTKNPRITCQWTTHFSDGTYSNAVAETRIAKQVVTTIIDKGPLFPRGYRGPMLNMILHGGWLEEKAFLGATLSQQGGSLVQDMPNFIVYPQDGENREYVLPSHLKMLFRKNNGQIAFFIPAPPTKEEGILGMTAESYGYCYRK